MSAFKPEDLKPYVGKELTFVCKGFNVTSTLKESGSLLKIEDEKGLGLLPLAEVVYVQVKNAVQPVKSKIVT